MTAVAELLIPSDHPAFEGHFPGAPIVPGVVLLDSALHAMAANLGLALESCTLTAVKFKSVVRPGQPVEVHFVRTEPALVRFELTSEGRPVASGTLALR
jgi:3-hydroxyacyl-[acyl-carrier-protein] dehydratase